MIGTDQLPPYHPKLYLHGGCSVTVFCDSTSIRPPGSAVRKNDLGNRPGIGDRWHLLTTPRAQAYIAANSEEQARVVFEYARDVALHPAVDQEFAVRYRELRRPDGGFLPVRAADASKLLGLTPTLAVLDEYCEAKDDSVYAALRTALLPGATMFTITTAGVGVESPLGRLRARALAQDDIRVRGSVTDARGPGIRMLQWMVPEETSITDYRAAKRANPLSLITRPWLREQREAVHELHYRRFHRNEWAGRIGSWLPAGSWQACANGSTPIEEGSRIWVGIDIGGARADTAIVWLDEPFRVGCRIWSGDDAIMDATAFLPALAERYRIAEVSYDPWRAQVLAKTAEQHGIKVTAFPQSDNRMIPASAALHQAIVEGKLHNPDDEKLNEHVAAAVAKHGRRGWRIDQAERGGNIDALIALVMAYEARTAPEPAPTQVLGWDVMAGSFCVVCRRRIPKGSRCSKHRTISPSGRSWHKPGAAKRHEWALKRDGYRCTACGTTESLTVHHIVPVSEGGSDDLGNLRTLCERCHLDAHLPPAA